MSNNLNDADLLNRFVISRKSILDTLFVDMKRGRVAFATLTQDGLTNFYSVDDSGRMHDIAKIHWEAKGSMDLHEIEFKGQTTNSQELLHRSKRHFKSWLLGIYSWIFTAGNQSFKWKRMDIGGSGGWWTCHSIGPPATLAANYIPRQYSSGLRNGDLRVSDAALEVLDSIIVTLIVLTTRDAAWRTVKSPYSRDRLEASLRSDATGSLPPYLPQLPVSPQIARRNSNRPSTGRPRRPRTAGARPYADNINPPAYASRTDLLTPY